MWIKIKISKKIELNLVINMINTQNEYEYIPDNVVEEGKIEMKNNTENKTNNISESNKEQTYYEKLRENIIEKQLINYLNSKNNESLMDLKKANSVVFFLLCLIIYSGLFDIIYKFFYPEKSIFHIFNDFIICFKIACCDYEEEDDINNSIFKETNKKEIKIYADNDENSPHMIKVNSN